MDFCSGPPPPGCTPPFLPSKGGLDHPPPPAKGGPNQHGWGGELSSRLVLIMLLFWYHCWLPGRIPLLPQYVEPFSEEVGQRLEMAAKHPRLKKSRPQKAMAGGIKHHPFHIFFRHANISPPPCPRHNVSLTPPCQWHFSKTPPEVFH